MRTESDTHRKILSARQHLIFNMQMGNEDMAEAYAQLIEDLEEKLVSEGYDIHGYIEVTP
jgi:hypothetical protein